MKFVSGLITVNLCFLFATQVLIMKEIKTLCENMTWWRGDVSSLFIYLYFICF